MISITNSWTDWDNGHLCTAMISCSPSSWLSCQCCYGKGEVYWLVLVLWPSVCLRHSEKFWYFHLACRASTFEITNLSTQKTRYENSPQHLRVTAGDSNTAPGELPSCKFSILLQPQSNTPVPTNQGAQGYLIITGRCVGAGLELKSAGQ